MLNCHRERFRKLTFRSDEGLKRSKRQLSKSFTVAIQHLSTRLIKPNFCFDLPHRRSITVSLELEIHFSSLVHFGVVSTPPHKFLVTGLYIQSRKTKNYNECHSIMDR